LLGVQLVLQQQQQQQFMLADTRNHGLNVTQKEQSLHGQLRCAVREFGVQQQQSPQQLMS
jgi:hypothetical protein